MKGAVSAIKLGKADCDPVQRQVLLTPAHGVISNSHSRILQSRGGHSCCVSRMAKQSSAAQLPTTPYHRYVLVCSLLTTSLTQRHYSTHQYRIKAARSDSSSKDVDQPVSRSTFWSGLCIMTTKSTVRHWLAVREPYRLDEHAVLVVERGQTMQACPVFAECRS